MQTLPVRLHADPDGFFDQADGFLLRDISDHLQIDRRPREDHPFGMELLLFRQALISVTQFVAEAHRVLHQSIRLFLAELPSQLPQEIRETAQLFIVSLIDPVLMTASGCGRQENADKADNNITIYKSNENADGFDTETVSLDALTPENIMVALIDAGVVPSDVKVLDFKQEEDTITLDLSKTFEEYINQMGTAGEYATVGSVVNTYLDAYDAKAVSLLVEGGTWSTGHAEYETLQGRYTYDAQE